MPSSRNGLGSNGDEVGTRRDPRVRRATPSPSPFARLETSPVSRGGAPTLSRAKRASDAIALASARRACSASANAPAISSGRSWNSSVVAGISRTAAYPRPLPGKCASATESCSGRTKPGDAFGGFGRRLLPRRYLGASSEDVRPLRLDAGEGGSRCDHAGFNIVLATAPGPAYSRRRWCGPGIASLPPRGDAAEPEKNKMPGRAVPAHLDARFARPTPSAPDPGLARCE